jgi:hypothetical protein
MDSGSDAPSEVVLIARFVILGGSSQAVELGVNDAGGKRHVSRHNPNHRPYSCLARRHSDVGPQPSLGVWAFWYCRPHPHHRHYLGSAG